MVSVARTIQETQGSKNQRNLMMRPAMMEYVCVKLNAEDKGKIAAFAERLDKNVLPKAEAR